jgi:hypothetical protein
MVLAVVLALSASASQAAESRVPEWLQGFWQMTQDEDQGPTGNLAEFRSDGTYVYYERDCAAHPAVPFHMHDGEIFVMNFIPKKGPVSVMFHPSADHRSFTYTSPRTFNNARFERVELTACKKHR